MRHNRRGRKLNRTSEHRIALRRNLVQSLIEHGRVRTTLPKAKEVRAFADKIVSLAIDGSLAARQRALSLLNDRQIIPKQHQEAYDMLSDAKRAKTLRSRSGRRYRESVARPGLTFTAESVMHRLFTDVGPKMKARNERLGSSGGYTRIIKLADRRIGDAGTWCYLEFVGSDDEPRPQNTDRTGRKRRAKVKYMAYAGKPIQRRVSRKSGKAAEADEVEETATAVAEAPVEETAAPEAEEPKTEAPEAEEAQADGTDETKAEDKSDEKKE